MNRLSHPLIGRDPLVTGGAILLLGLLSLGVLTQFLFGAYVFVDDRFLAAKWLFDGFVGALILAIGLSWILSMLYAWANGGPLLAVFLAIIPMMLAAGVRFTVAANVDIALAMASATVAVWLGCWVSYPPGETRPYRHWIAVLGGGVTGIASAVVWRLSGAVGAHAEGGLLLAALVLLSGLIMGTIWAVAHLRAEG